MQTGDPTATQGPSDLNKAGYHALRLPDAGQTFVATYMVDGILGSRAHLPYFTAGFAECRSQREAEVEVQRESGCSSRLGRALLDLAVVVLAQGETQVANTCIKEALALSDLSDDTVFQLLTYQLHCQFMQFQYSPSRHTMQKEELKASVNFERELPKWHAGITAAGSKVSTRSLRLLHNVLSLQRSAWSARTFQPSFQATESTQGNFSGRAEADIKCFTSAKLDRPILEALRVDLADIYHTEGQSDKSREIIDKLITQSQDYSCLGSCRLILGDWKAASYSVPEVWNMFPTQGVDSNTQAREREWQEFKTEGLDITVARSEYKLAKQYFQRIGHERGLGAVELRLAYLDTIEASTHSDKPSHYRKALRHASSAKERYHSAADWAGYYLACVHVELCKIGTGQMALDRDQLIEIGHWGRSKGSWSFVMGIGLLIARYARRWQIAEGDYERSLAAFTLAEALFSDLGTPLSHAYSLTDLAMAFDALGDRTRFFIIAQRALERCMQPLSASFSVVERLLSVHAGFVVNRMMIRAIKIASPDDIELAAEYARRLLEPRPNSDSQGGASLPQPGTGSLLAALGLGQGYSRGTFVSLLARLQIEQNLHQADFLGPFYRSRLVRRDGKKSKIEADTAAEALIQQSETALRAGGGFANQDLLFEMSLSAERLNFQEAATICEEWLRRHEQSLGAALKQPQGRDWRSLEENQRRDHLLNGAQAFQRCRAYTRANDLLDQLKQEYSDGWWEQGSEPWANLVLAGQVLEGLGQFETASSCYQRAAGVFEERRMRLTGDEYKMALSSNASAHEAYFAAARAFVKWHQSVEAAGTLSLPSDTLAKAFQASERGKARSLLDLVAGGSMFDQLDVVRDTSFEIHRAEAIKLTTARALLAEVYSQKTPNQEILHKMEQDVAELEQSVRALELQQAQMSPGSSPLHINATVVSFEELKQHLSEDTLMLQFGYWSSDIVSWAVSRDGMVAVHHAREHQAELEYHAHRFRYLCETGDYGEEGVAQWLTKTLLQPFSELIRKKRNLVIVPHGTLHLVPFHALPFDGTVLCAHHTISYEPSASVFCDLVTIDAKDSKILAVGNPANMQRVDRYTGEKKTIFDQLECAELEANYIVTMSLGSLALTRDKATKAAVLQNLPNFDIIHFATHGDADANVPLLSAVYLANGESLTVADLMNQRLRAKLVVLSACRSGEGELAGGDEIMGFSRALLAAGVQSVVVSLWPVDDQRTTLLMEEFYNGLLKGQAPAAALQAAQNTTRQYSESEVEQRLLRIANTVVKSAAKTKTANAGSRIAAGEEMEPAPRNASQMGINNRRYWAPFIIVGR